jgi:tetratricopeptide (TPR) repeat protein
MYFSAVPPLEPKDRFLVQSASGWLMLGNAGEALHELAQVSLDAQNHLEVLVLRWEIDAQAHRWSDAVAVADRLIAHFPGQSEGYIKRAYALHELKCTQQAWDTLAPARERFDTNWLIPYNLACYACQLGRSTEALNLFKDALHLGDKDELCAMALKDTDLQPIRTEVERLAK